MTDLIGPVCPGCGAKLDLPRSDILDGRQPTPGQVCVCWWCGFLSEYVGDPLSLRPLPTDHPMHDDPQVQKIREDIRVRMARRQVRRVV